MYFSRPPCVLVLRFVGRASAPNSLCSQEPVAALSCPELRRVQRTGFRQRASANLHVVAAIHLKAKMHPTGSAFARLESNPRGPEDRGYRFLLFRSSTYAFTVSKASAAFINRFVAKYSSACRTKASRSASLANSTATPPALSGVTVGAARNSLQLNPRSPGKVAHPS